MRKFWNITRPVNFYKRDKQVFNQAEKGTLTSRSLLEIEYGEFPMKGINISNVNERPVNLKGFFENKRHGILPKLIMSVIAGGYVQNKKIPLEKPQLSGDENQEQEYERTIYLNRLMHSPLLQGAIIKSAHFPLVQGLAHLATSAAPLMKTATAVIGFFKAHTLATAVMISSLRLSPLVQLLSLPFRASMDTIGHEHVHVLQVHDEAKTGVNISSMNLCNNLKNSFSSLGQMASSADDFLSIGIAPYLRKDFEIQARMHTVLAEGYRNEWKCLPKTKHELWGALISMGLNAPSEIRREVAKSAEEGVKNFYKPGLKPAFGRASQKCTNRHVADLNVVHRSLLTDKVREKYWREVLPFLYGHLVELYGDPQGRQRMGIPNPAAAPSAA